MKRNILKKAVFLITITGLSLNSFADSDGTYCVTEEYVAVEAKGIYIPIKEHSWIVVSYSMSGIGAEKVISVNDKRVTKFNCSNSNAEYIHKGQLSFIEKPEIIKLVNSETGGEIKLVSSITRENKVVNGAGPIFHYFSLSMIESNANHQVIETKSIASGVRYESIH